MSINRRKFIAMASASPLLIASPDVFAKQIKNISGERSLRLFNPHTGERVKAVYWADGEYSIEGLADIYLLMRDHRQNLIAPIDIKLLDQLHNIKESLEYNKEIIMVSGYRSEKTNNLLREKGVGVAKQSLHTEGKAVDFCLPGKNLRNVHRASLSSTIGGVGYYPQSGFIHIDVGRKRRWSL